MWMVFATAGDWDELDAAVAGRDGLAFGNGAVRDEDDSSALCLFTQGVGSGDAPAGVVLAEVRQGGKVLGGDVACEVVAVLEAVGRSVGRPPA